ncbi:uncharacterized protein VTP21DRAFT_1784 [Calcarisporiella thermophila]|uniref:uncharacterized protein n=1 Tax=Calcarisporiella thermophila TaxID=911321 RepID=UPI0037446B09
MAEFSASQIEAIKSIPIHVPPSTQPTHQAYPNLIDMPMEVLLHLISLLPPTSISILSCTCHHLHSIIQHTDSLWQRFCIEAGCREIGKWPVKNFRELYTNVVHRYAWLVGTWVGDAAFFGSLLVVRWEPRKGRIGGYKIHCRNRTPNKLSSYSLDERINISQFEPVYDEQRLFALRLDAKRPRDAEAPLLRVTTRCQDESSLTIPSHGVVFYRGKFKPHPRTGLWSLESQGLFPPEFEEPQEELYRYFGNKPGGSVKKEDFDYEDRDKEKETDTPCFGLGCVHKAKTRQSNPVQLFAKLPSWKLRPTMDRPLDGLWAGDYAPNGVEFLLLSTIKGTLYAYKLTGDMNVPRGEISIKVDMSSPVRICHEREFAGKPAFKAQGQVAYIGYEKGHMIDAEMILISNNRLALHFFELYHILFYQRFMTKSTKDSLPSSTGEKSNVIGGNNIEDHENIAEAFEGEAPHDEKKRSRAGGFGKASFGWVGDGT